MQGLITVSTEQYHRYLQTVETALQANYVDDMPENFNLAKTVIDTFIEYVSTTLQQYINYPSVELLIDEYLYGRSIRADMKHDVVMFIDAQFKQAYSSMAHVLQHAVLDLTSTGETVDHVRLFQFTKRRTALIIETDHDD